MANFVDGIKNVFSELVNRRAATYTNRTEHIALDYTTMNDMYKSGLGSKIVRLKAGAALSDSIIFASTEDEDFYNKFLSRHVKAAARYMVAFGRGIVVFHNRGEDLTKRLGKIDQDRLIVRSFSGDMVTCHNVDLDFESDMYRRPRVYNVYGHPIHYSRVIDFRYIQPTELDLPLYRYGGISEFELIYDQFIADGVLQRACPAILERSSNWIYKIKDLNQAIRSKRDSDIINVFSTMENMRSIYGATLIDAEDNVESLSQSLQNLQEIDQIALRRLAMVTGIPLAILIGENVKGLNSTGENEMTSYNNMLKTFQADYLIDPISEAMVKCGQAAIEFSDNQQQSPTESAAYEKSLVETANLMNNIGLDGAKYLEDKGIVEKEDFESYFEGGSDLSAVGEGNVDISSIQDVSLNGAQVTALMSVIEKVSMGLLPKSAAIKIMASAFPISEAAAAAMMDDVVEGSTKPQEIESNAGTKNLI